MDRRVRAAPGAAGPGVEGVHPLPQRGPRRRDAGGAGGAAGAGQGQDEEGLCVGVAHDQLRAPARGVLRLLHATALASIRGASCTSSPARW